MIAMLLIAIERLPKLGTKIATFYTAVSESRSRYSGGTAAEDAKREELRKEAQQKQVDELAGFKRMTERWKKNHAEFGDPDGETATHAEELEVIPREKTAEGGTQAKIQEIEEIEEIPVRRMRKMEFGQDGEFRDVGK